MGFHGSVEQRPGPLPLWSRMPESPLVPASAGEEPADLFPFKHDDGQDRP